MYLLLDAFSSPALGLLSLSETWTREESSCCLNQIIHDQSRGFFLVAIPKYLSVRSLEPNSPILIRALLLHLDSLVQLAVRGTEIVIPLHFDLSTIVLRRFCRVFQTCVCPGFAPFEALSFPTVSFQRCCRPAGRGLGRNRPITQRPGV